MPIRRSTVAVTATSIVTLPSVRTMSGSISTATSRASGPIGTPMASAIGPVEVTKLMRSGQRGRCPASPASTTAIAGMSAPGSARPRSVWRHRSPPPGSSPGWSRGTGRRRAAGRNRRWSRAGRACGRRRAWRAGWRARTGSRSPRPAPAASRGRSACGFCRAASDRRDSSRRAAPRPPAAATSAM